MPRKIYSQEEKENILTRAAEIGVSKTAKEYSVPYATVAKWMGTSTRLNEATDTAALIEVCEREIAALDTSLKTKKAELKALQKQMAEEAKEAEKKREAAAKAEAERKAAEDKKKLIQALSESGKSVDEILAFLNSNG